MKKEKPAESADVYLKTEDKRLYEELVKVTQVLKQGLCPGRIPRGLGYPLAQVARKQYLKAVKEATLYWGAYEISNVYGKPREEEMMGYVGSFDSIAEAL